MNHTTVQIRKTATPNPTPTVNQDEKTKGHKFVKSHTVLFFKKINFLFHLIFAIANVMYRPP